MRLLRHMTWVVAVAWAATASAGEDRNIYLAQAKVFYQGLEFEKCLQRLEQAGRLSDISREEMAQIELYTGLCRFNLGKRQDAESNFKLALQLDPDISLPPETSPRITQVFEALALQVRKPKPAAQPSAPAQVASAPASSTEAAKTASATRPDTPREVKLEPSQSQQRTDLVAAGPQQGGSKVLPIALGGTAVASAAVGAVFGVMARNHEAQANNPATFYEEAQKLGNDARREATTANVFLGVAGAAAVGAVITWITAD